MLASLALAAVLPAAAQEPITRFQVFAPQRVIDTSVRAKKVFAELEVLNKTLTEKLKAKGEELQKLDQQIKSPAIAEEGRAKLQREFQDGELAFKRLQEDSQAEFQKSEQKATAQFNQEIGPILLDLAKEQKLQMLFQWNQQIMIPVDPAAVTAFSDEVAKRYDKKYENGAPAAEKPASTVKLPPTAKPAVAPKPAPAKK
jgi:Skp family chaperone for outer membrane proteins